MTVDRTGAVAAGRLLHAGTLRGAVRLAQIRPLYVLGSFVAVEWLTTLGLALTVRHNGWLYYQGGDQVWFYTTSWLLRHGELPPTAVGYGESVLLMPFTLFGDANLLHVLPAIVLLNVVFLMPVALLAMYGIGERLGGRLFGYWVALLWIVLPFIGIKYTDAGFHQRYTELALPQAFGLTAMSDFPSMVMLAVAAYFVVRALQSRSWSDGFLAGSFGGFGIGVKPSSSLYLGGVVLAVFASRHWRAGVAMLAGLSPCLIALTFWKWRGLGHIPIFGAQPATRIAMGSVGMQLPGQLRRYINLNWAQLGTNLASLQEHFWSARLVEWTVLAGIIGLSRRSRPAACLAGGWFIAFFVIKGSGQLGSLEDGSLLRMLIPAIPAFVLIVAGLPLLLPGLRSRKKSPGLRPFATLRLQQTVAVAATTLFAVVPVMLAGVAHPLGTSAAAYYQSSDGTGPVPSALPISVAVHGLRVRLSWPAARTGTIRAFYVVRRAQPGCLGTGNSEPSAVRDDCLRDIVRVRGQSWTETLSRGQYGYRILESANWLDQPLAGDPYLASRWIPVTIR